MQKKSAAKSKGSLQGEVPPQVIIALLGVVAVLAIGFFFYQNSKRPKMLTGTAGATAAGQEGVVKVKDEVTGKDTTKY